MTKHDVMSRLYVCNEVHLHRNHGHALTACPLVGAEVYRPLVNKDITHKEH